MSPCSRRPCPPYVLQSRKPTQHRNVWAGWAFSPTTCARKFGIMRSPLSLPYREWRRLCRRTYAAQQKDHSEVAGLFAVGDGRELFLIFIKNSSKRPLHFEFEWPQFWQSRRKIRELGGRYIGIFHSHPVSYAEPGPGDIRNSHVNGFHLIYDVCGTNARLWRIVRRGRRKVPVEIPLQIERTPSRSLRKRTSHL